MARDAARAGGRRPRRFWRALSCSRGAPSSGSENLLAGKLPRARRRRGEPGVADRRTAGRRRRRMERARRRRAAVGARRRRLRPRAARSRSTRALPAGRQQRRIRGRRLGRRHHLSRALGRAAGRGGGPARAIGRRPGRAGALGPPVRARGRSRLFGDELQLWSGRPSAFPPRPEAVSPEARAAGVRTRFIYLVLAFGLVLFATREGWPSRRTARALAAARRSRRR